MSKKDIVEDIYPLSPMQQGMLFHTLYDPTAGVYIQQKVCSFRGELDLVAFKRAWQQVIDRHTILRTTFIWERRAAPFQVVYRQVSLPWQQHNWHRMRPAEQQEQLAEWLHSDRARGFDLSKVPLMRLTLIQLGEDSYYFIWSHHHLLLDGWSVPLVLKDVFTCYHAFHRGQELSLDPPRPYGDYIAWLQEQDVSKAEAFWRQMLMGFRTPTSLVVNRGPDSRYSSVERYDEKQIQLTAVTTMALQELAQREFLTLSSFVQGAWAVLLSRYSREEDVVFGVTVSGRPVGMAGIETMVGLFINTLPIRVQVAPGAWLLAWLKHLQARHAEVREYEYSPLVQVQGWSEVSRGTPLFETIVVFENYPAQSDTQPNDRLNLTIHDLWGVERTNYPLTIAAIPGSALTLKISYDGNQIDVTTVERMLGHMRTLLEGMLAEPAQRLTDLPLLTTAERQQVLVDWNRTQVEYPRDWCVYELFEAQAARIPDSVAVNDGQTINDERPEQRHGDTETRRHAVQTQRGNSAPNAQSPTSNTQHLTYHELNARSNQLAHYLQRLGVGTDVRVGICMERSLVLAVGLLGILKAGGAYVPLDPSYPQERLAFMLADAQVSALLTQRHLGVVLPLGAATLIYLDADWPIIAQEPATSVFSGVAVENLAYVIYTSGSTGQPKGVLIAHQAMVNHNLAIAQQYQMHAGDRIMHGASLSFDFAIEELFPPWVSGATVILMPEGLLTAIPLFMQWVARMQLTILLLPTAYWHEWVQHLALAAYPLPAALRLVAIGGERALPERLRAWQQLPDAHTTWINTYGPTEATVSCILYSVTAEEPLWGGAEVPIGHPIANVQVYVLDRAQQPVPVGIPGELYLGGRGLARGYLHRPDVTAERFVPNPFVDGEEETKREGDKETGSPSPFILHPSSFGSRLYRTGDLVRYLPTGDIEYLGRMDQQVKIRGFRIEPGEIEAALAQCAIVREVAVLAYESIPGHKQLVAYIVPTAKHGPGEQNLTTSRSLIPNPQSPIPNPSFIDDVRHFLQVRLPTYMVPAVFIVLDALPLTPNGKVDRHALPAPDQGRSTSNEDFVVAHTAIEEVLAEIWAEVLGLERVGIHDNFFALGGDSILSIQIIARAKKAGLRFTPRQLFQHQTIAALAAVADSAFVITAQQGPVSGSVPLTPIQHWFFAQNLPAPHHFNQALLLEVRQRLNALLLYQTIRHLLAYHDALRMRFICRANGWEQINVSVESQPVVTWADITALQSAAQGLAIEAIAADLQRSLNLADGPLVRVAYMDLGTSQPGRLLLIVHHLVVDGVSWRVLLEDFQTVYGQLQRNERVTLPSKTTSFQQWAERLTTYTQSSALRQEQSYWVTPARHHIARLPVDYPGRSNTIASARSVTVALNTIETHALLQKVPEVYRTQINDVLLTALAQAWVLWTGESTLLIDLEGHGREDLFDDVDLSRTVGWFTTIFPVLLDLRQVHGPGAALKAVKEQLRLIPYRGIGYGVLRYLGMEAEFVAALRALPAAELSFNYLGQLDQAVPTTGLFGPAHESSGPARCAQGLRSHLLEINSMIAEGQLQLIWIYSEQVHDRATIERLAQGYVSTLRVLIAHCQSPRAGGYTPSDFPLAHLDQPTLDRLVGTDRHIEAIYPLTPMQQGMLFHTLYEAGSGMYVEQLVCSVQGDVDIRVFQRAWQQVLERHPVFRTAFVWEGLNEPLQIVRQAVALPWSVEDLRGRPVNEQDAWLADFLTEDRRRGFALAQAPLLRLTLCQLAQDTYRFVWSHHHLLLDGWSVPIVLNEVFSYYNEFRCGRAIELATVRPYQDYVAWLQRQDLAKAEAFWSQTLAGVTAPTSLGIDRLVTEDTGAASPAQQRLLLTAVATSALQSMAREHRLTLNTIIQGAWALLLSRYSDELDVIFGVTVSGRPPDLAGIETMVGLFINTLPIRVRVVPDEPLLPWLQQMQAQQVELRQYEYSSLAQVQGWSSVTGGQALFESILVFENYPVEITAVQPGDQISLVIQDVQSVEQTNYPLTVEVMPSVALAITISYDERRFDATTIVRMLEHMRTLLEGMASEPARYLMNVPLMTEAERWQLLVEWNATTIVYPQDACIHQLFEAQVARAPDAVALVFDGRMANDERRTTTSETRSQGAKETKLSAETRLPTSDPHPPTPTSLHLTYRDLNARANQLAHHLQEMGVRPDALVGICIERSPEMLVGLLGILKAEGAYVPLDPTYPQERLAFMLADSQMQVLLTQRRLASTLPNHAVRLICLDELRAPDPSANSSDPPSPANPQNLAYVIYTSGSTGQPKGVLVTHQNLVHSTSARRHSYQDPPEHYLLLSSLAFDSSIVGLFWTLCEGGCLILPTEGLQREVRALAALIARWRITHILSLPSLHALLLSEATSEQLASLRVGIVAGETCPREVVERHAALLPQAALFNEYGPTEGTVWSSVHRCDTAERLTSVPIGRPIANVRLYLLDALWQPVPVGVPGELYIGGGGLARGYLGRPDLTAERFVPNLFIQDVETRRHGDMETEEQVAGVAQIPSPIPRPLSSNTRLYRTGDRARYRPDGNLEFLGRRDGQVKLRGYRVELGEIEAVLNQYPVVHESVVVAREDMPGGKRLVAYVVPTNDQGRTTNDRPEHEANHSSWVVGRSSFIRELRAFIAERLPDYMVPSAFVGLEVLPRTPSGKVDRCALPVPDSGGSCLEGVLVAARTPVEELLAQIWSNVLGLDRVGVQDNFFALGGHSLLAIQVIARVHDNFGVEVSLRSLFEAPTIAEFAGHIEAAQSDMLGLLAPPLRPVARNGPLPLSYAQQRLWFLDQLLPDSPAYTVPATLWLEGPLDVAALEQGLNAIVERHEILRTTFAVRDEHPVQVIAPAQMVWLPLFDLQALPLEEREPAALRLVMDANQQPFDLTRGPLLRVVLLRLAADEHVLLFNLHHIVSDGWSIGVLVREVTTFYSAYSQGNPTRLPDLPIQYADYAVWQRTWLQGEVLETQLAYWHQQLASLAVLQLPTDYSRSPAFTLQGAYQNFVLPPTLSTQLIALSRREGVTLFMTLLAAWQVLLARYSNQDDIVVGTPIAGRTRAESEGLIGLFINTLVLRTDLSRNPSFQALLRQVREICLGAYTHQDAPFEQVVEALQPARDLSRHPLFQVMIILRNEPLAPLSLPGLTVRPLPSATTTALFDLTLSLMETEAGLAGTLEYSTDLFTESTIIRMIQHFKTLLEGIATDPAQCLADMSLLTIAERWQLLVEWNSTQVAYRKDCCIHDLFTAQVEQRPDTIAVVFDGRMTTDQRPMERQGDKETRRQGDTAAHRDSILSSQFSALSPEQLTYDELNARANQFARYLRSLGVGPEVRVGIFLERSLELLIALLGVLKAGGAYVPLDTAYPQERLTFMLADAQVAVLLTQAELIADLHTCNAQVVRLDMAWNTIAAESVAPFRSDVTVENLAYLIYTSGSTGKPKGVQIPHRAVINFLHAMQERPGLTERDTLLAVTTLSFDIAALELFLPLTVGARLALATRAVALDGVQLGAYLHQAGVTVMQATPTMWQLLLDAGWVGDRAITILCGGEALLRDLANQLLARCGTLWNMYGPTETTIWSACSQVGMGTETVPLGRAIANTHLYVLDRHLQPVPVGVPGELYIGGDGLGRGYLSRPELTAERFVPNPFGGRPGVRGQGLGASDSSNTQHPTPNTRLYRTGDLARYRADGMVEFLGRLDDQVKVRGYRIELGEVAAVLRQHPAVQEAVAMVREDVPGDKRLVAYVMAGTEDWGLGAGNVTPIANRQSLIPELRAFLQTQLPAYMLPSAIVALQALPLAPNGKLDRRALPAPDSTRSIQDDALVVPRTSVEEVLAMIWAEVLDLDQVGVYDNFFDLGGHSLLATQVISRIRETLRVELPLLSLFEAPTVADLATTLLQDQTKPKNLERRAELLLSLAQLSEDEAEGMLESKASSHGKARTL